MSSTNSGYIRVGLNLGTREEDVDTGKAGGDNVPGDGTLEEVIGDYGDDAALVLAARARRSLSCYGVQTRHTTIGMPIPAYSSTVPNPKDVFDKIEFRPQAIRATIAGAKMEVALNIWVGNYHDLAQVLRLPVSMALQAVDAMTQVRMPGGQAEDKLKTEKKKELILTIMTAVLCVVPFVGELLMPAEVAVGTTALLESVLLPSSCGLRTMENVYGWCTRSFTLATLYKGFEYVLRQMDI
ncbi:hypothetical protein B0H63DRAFT_453962 [Podospora didyma]|uniref:Uncharacterized protein n=1 Tax=Podospora didyma TaxID=330526 RepID=A0AAE0KAI0_9PEZI|nr:hypothetical protein B0H63DRAFT_453962 [Podospora didyma]